jgi:hypothetical protein
VTVKSRPKAKEGAAASAYWKARVVKVALKVAREQLPELVDGKAGYDARRLLSDVIAAPVNVKKLIHALAWSMCQRDRCGGPERGIWVNYGGSDESLAVRGTRNVRLGTYYPPSGNGEDYEDGGLSSASVVVLISTDCGEVISGDYERAP